MIRTPFTAALGATVGLALALLAPTEQALPVAELQLPAVGAVMAPEVVELAQVIEKAAPALTSEFRFQLAATVVEEGARNNIEPLRLLAVISVESEFDPEACSSKQARGLLQVRDATRNAMAEKEGLHSCDADPLVNVRLGARYLGLLKRQFKGRETLALMAYNAGPQRLVKAIANQTTAALKPYVKAVDREYSQLKALRPRGELLATKLQFASQLPTITE